MAMIEQTRQYSEEVLLRRRHFIIDRRIRSLAMIGKSCAFAYIDAR